MLDVKFVDKVITRNKEYDREWEFTTVPLYSNNKNLSFLIFLEF